MSMSVDVESKQRKGMDRFLNGVERLGNKLPEPFTLFTALFLITAVACTIMAWFNVVVDVPGTDEPTPIKGFFTGEGLAWFTSNIGENYIGFPPLKTVVPILLAIAIAEQTGFLSAMIRKVVGSAPGWLLPYAVGFIGVAGSIMADSAFVVIPPLAMIAFKAAGRHPVAGLIGGFAAAGAGYSTNFVPTSLDALFAGITNSVITTVPMIEQNADPINPVSNYFFNLASAFVLAILAGFIIDKVVEPQVNRLGISRDEIKEPTGLTEELDAIVDEGEDTGIYAQRGTGVEQSREVEDHKLTDIEKKGLRRAFLVLGILAVVVIAAILVPASPWRNEDGGFLPKSPLLDSIVFLVFTVFAVGGYVYGKKTGAITGYRDVPKLMGGGIVGMTSFLVLAFVLGNFIALFNWSGIGSWIAVEGAELLERMHLSGFGAIVLFIVLCSILNLFIISGSGMWAIMAAVFVPMFGLLGYEPSFIQGAFRVGDSATQIITPMNPYMIVFLGFLRRYEPKAGMGTIISRMLPFVIPFWIAWTVILFIFFQFDLPMGPGNGIMMDIP